MWHGEEEEHKDNEEEQAGQQHVKKEEETNTRNWVFMVYALSALFKNLCPTKPWSFPDDLG
jgi:hypothetical protein